MGALPGPSRLVALNLPSEEDEVVVMIATAEAVEEVLELGPGTLDGSWWTLVTWALPWEPISLFFGIMKGPPLPQVRGAVELAPWAGCCCFSLKLS